MSETRALVLGVGIGAALAAIPLWLLSEPAVADLPGVGARVGAGGEVEQLRAEVAELRRAAASEDAERTRLGRDSADPSTVAAVPASAPRGDGPDAVSPTVERLLGELEGDFVGIALAARFRGDPTRLYEFLLETWLEAGQPDRALDVFLRYELPPDAGNWAGRLAEELRKAGNEQGAVLACAAALRGGLVDSDAMRHLLELAPEQALELLQGGPIPYTDENQQAAYRGAALLCSGRVDEAWATLDPQIDQDGLGSSIWSMLVERSPEQAIERLRAKLATADGNAGRRYQLLLARALDAAGQPDHALAAVDAVLQDSPIDRSALRTLAKLDRSRALDHLERLTRTAPSDDVWGRYAEYLQQAGRTQEAVGALTRAVEIDADSSWTRQLLRLAPEVGARRLAVMARGKRDDELLGDIADELWRAGRKQQAETLWHEAHDIDPGDGEWTGKLRSIARGWDPMR